MEKPPFVVRKVVSVVPYNKNRNVLEFSGILASGLLQEHFPSLDQPILDSLMGFLSKASDCVSTTFQFLSFSAEWFQFRGYFVGFLRSFENNQSFGKLL